MTTHLWPQPGTTHHIPGHSEDLHPRSHISLVQNLGAFIVLVTDLAEELLLQPWNTINM